jgi:CheY-like chemotaxis protein
VAQTEEEKPDLVLLDVHLGGKDGVQILRELRKNAALGDLRIVMTSGINMTDECLKAGANAFIVKPYMPENLLRLLSQVLAAPVNQKHKVEDAKPSSSESFQKFL